MLKRISNLLFEDDVDDDELDDEEETSNTPVVSKPVKPAPVMAKRDPVSVQPSARREQVQMQPPVQPKKEPVVMQEPVMVEAGTQEKIAEENARTVMQRIDLTQKVTVDAPERPQPKRTESLFSEPSSIRQADVASSDARHGSTSPIPVAKPSGSMSSSTSARQTVSEQRPPIQTTTLGIKADPVIPQTKPTRPERPKKDPIATYQFQPVISPIFGVDEKDLNAVKTTTSKVSMSQQAKTDKNLTPIISPMYGTSMEQSTLSAAQPQVVIQPAPIVEPVVSTPVIAPQPIIQKEPEIQEKTPVVEDEIPEFSLDDILKVGDEEFAKEKRAVDNDDSLFPDFFGDDDEEEDDASLRESIVFNRRTE